MPEIRIIAYHNEASKLQLAKVLMQQLSFTMGEASAVMHAVTRGEEPSVCIVDRAQAMAAINQLIEHGVVLESGGKIYDLSPDAPVLPAILPDLSPSAFLTYSLRKMANQFSELSCYLHEYPEEGNWAYQIPSPANPENILTISLCRDELIIKFAVRGSHEHFHLRDAEGETDEEQFGDVWRLAWEESIGPVLENKLVIIWHAEGLGGGLTSNPDHYIAQLKSQGTTEYKLETWS